MERRRAVDTKDRSTMFVYAGIDEAGYGPMFGPLVIARSVFLLDGHEPSFDPPSMWGLMRSAVCRSPSDKKRRVAVNDSKVLYQPALTMKQLERGILSFLSTMGIGPANLAGLLETLAFDRTSHRINHEWYRSGNGEPSVPFLLPLPELDRAARRVAGSMGRSGIRLDDVRAAVVFEDRFNRMVRAWGSKAACAWAFVAGHLKSIWLRYGEYHPLAVVDRQGGRRNYEGLLETVFFPAEVSTVFEGSQKSGYLVRHGVRRMSIQVQVASERRHFPVALASMAAKYVRELLMSRFQSYWSARAPEIRPTFGYFGDGKRFLREIRPVLTELKIDPADLVRCR
jgi:ribonuclease HII